MFFCHIPAQEGGETPIADSRRVLLALSNETRRRFEKEGITYMRHLAKGVGMSWEQVFNTNDKTEVESYCRKTHTDFEWKPDGSLVIKWKRPAIMTHPVTSEKIWFNHGLFFNSFALGEEKLAVLKDALPFETFYGNGEPIEKAVLEEIAAAYDKSIVTFPWEKGDLLLLDNMLMAHGRNSFRGKREIMVAMAEEIHGQNQNP
jgi:alpha-ketoglutarate-dependent taurine dioxygenase